MENIQLRNYIAKALKQYITLIALMMLTMLVILGLFGLLSLSQIWLNSYGKSYVAAGFFVVIALYCPLIFCIVYYVMEYMDDKKDQLRRKPKETLYTIRQDQKSA
ncbi:MULTISPECIES: hypothetical protein [Cysteiniphilum]|uniref:hypothetical protein n=1 Tax=Cysteiniphilum TaxID=2056696 RepID=UPI00177B20B5|nr:MULTISPECIES: hypothetical protein [Cysteiniphilum]